MKIVIRDSHMLPDVEVPDCTIYTTLILPTMRWLERSYAAVPVRYAKRIPYEQLARLVNFDQAQLLMKLYL